MLVQKRSGAVPKIKQMFKDATKPLTISDIREALPELKSPQISSLLCYFMRQGHLSRESVPNPKEKKRKMVWQYKYHEVTKQEIKNADRTTQDQ